MQSTLYVKALDPKCHFTIMSRHATTQWMDDFNCYGKINSLKLD